MKILVAMSGGVDSSVAAKLLCGASSSLTPRITVPLLLIDRMFPSVSRVKSPSPIFSLTV